VAEVTADFSMAKRTGEDVSMMVWFPWPPPFASLWPATWSSSEGAQTNVPGLRLREEKIAL
jgi:hypothetical protein